MATNTLHANSEFFLESRTVLLRLLPSLLLLLAILAEWDISWVRTLSDRVHPPPPEGGTVPWTELRRSDSSPGPPPSRVRWFEARLFPMLNQTAGPIKSFQRQPSAGVREASRAQNGKENGGILLRDGGIRKRPQTMYLGGHTPRM